MATDGRAAEMVPFEGLGSGEVPQKKNPFALGRTSPQDYAATETHKKMTHNTCPWRLPLKCVGFGVSASVADYTESGMAIAHLMRAA